MLPASLSATLRPSPNRNSHLSEGARFSVLVQDFRLPEPGGAAAVAGLGADFDSALGDRAEEADGDRLPHSHQPLLVDGADRRPGTDALDQRRHHATVHEAERLAQLVADLEPDAGVVGVVAEPLGADQLVEMRSLNLTLVVHGCAH